MFVLFVNIVKAKNQQKIVCLKIVKLSDIFCFAGDRVKLYSYLNHFFKNIFLFIDLMSNAVSLKG